MPLCVCRGAVPALGAQAPELPTPWALEGVGDGSIHATARHGVSVSRCCVTVVRRWALGSCRDKKQRDPLKHQRGTANGAAASSLILRLQRWCRVQRACSLRKGCAVSEGNKTPFSLFPPNGRPVVRVRDSCLDLTTW